MKGARGARKAREQGGREKSFRLRPLHPAPLPLVPNAQKQDPPSRVFHRARGIT